MRENVFAGSIITAISLLETPGLDLEADPRVEYFTVMRRPDHVTDALAEQASGLDCLCRRHGVPVLGEALNCHRIAGAGRGVPNITPAHLLVAPLSAASPCTAGIAAD